MRTTVGSALIGFILLGATSCVVSVDLSGRACPCDQAAGWSCDEDRNICIQGAFTRCGLDRATEASSIVLESFGVDWQTDTAAGLRWDVTEADAQRIDHYELALGATEEQARTRAAGAIVFDETSAEHPELLRGTLPDTQYGDVVDRTVLRDLAPDTPVHVRLVVFDTNGRTTCTDVLETRTRPAVRREDSIYDEVSFGWAIPTCTEHASDAGLASSGSSFARLRMLCEVEADGGMRHVCAPTGAAPASFCFQVIRLSGLGGPPVSLAEGPFRDGAHLRLDVAVDDSIDSFWTEIHLLTPPSTTDVMPLSEDLAFEGERQTIVSDGQYRSYSSPLSSMRVKCGGPQVAEDQARVDMGLSPICGRALTPADLSAGVTAVRLGVFSDNGGTVRVDRIQLRY